MNRTQTTFIFCLLFLTITYLSFDISTKRQAELSAQKIQRNKEQKLSKLSNLAKDQIAVFLLLKTSIKNENLLTGLDAFSKVIPTFEKNIKEDFKNYDQISENLEYFSRRMMFVTPDFESFEYAIFATQNSLEMNKLANEIRKDYE